MQINRLFEIIYILLDKKTVTANELAERFEVSVRTVYRDIELLSQSGIPVYTTRGKSGGISIMDNFVLDKSLLSESEQTEIIAALGAMSTLPNMDRTAIKDKLASLFRKSDTSWISVDFSDWSKGQKTVFDKLKNAVILKKTAEIEYINSRGKTSSRIIEPLKLYFKGRAWYVIAYCRQADDYRMFRLSRIKRITLTDDSFEREMPYFDYEDKSVDTIEVVLRISPEMEYRVYDEFDEFQKDADGYFTVKMNFPKDEWLYGYIMSFGEYASVISPESIKREIKEKIEKSLQNYL